jgi:hypothetical protein
VKVLEWLLVVTLVIAVGLALYTSRPRNWNRRRDWDLFFSTVFVAMFAGALVTALATILLFTSTDRLAWNHAKRITLGALSNSSETRGSFFLGSGTVGEKPVYAYVEVLEDGGQKLRQLDAGDNVTLYTSADPHIEVAHYESPLFNFRGDEEIRIYLPAGSVWQSYDVDVRK